MFSARFTSRRFLFLSFIVQSHKYYFRFHCPFLTPSPILIVHSKFVLLEKICCLIHPQFSRPFFHNVNVSTVFFLHLSFLFHIIPSRHLFSLTSHARFFCYPNVIMELPSLPYTYTPLYGYSLSYHPSPTSRSSSPKYRTTAIPTLLVLRTLYTDSGTTHLLY